MIRLNLVQVIVLVLVAAGFSSTSVPAGASPFRVTGVSLGVAGYEHPAAGVMKVNFTGSIRADGVGTAQYRFLRSDGALGPIQSVHFPAAGVVAVHTSWQLSANYEGWESLKIMYPPPLLESQKASFKVTIPQPRVTRVALQTERPVYHTAQGAVTAQFHGSIATSGPCNVQYRFIRSDGAQGAATSLAFDAAGTQPVHTSWSLSREYSGWVAIRVLSPNALESNRAAFRVESRPGARPPATHPM